MMFIQLVVRFSNARVKQNFPHLLLHGTLYCNSLCHDRKNVISYGRSGLRSHLLYKNQIWYPTGKYLFCAIFREDQVCYDRGEHTARKIANTTRIVNECRATSD